MGILSKIFSPKELVNKVTDSVTSGVDKLIYTNEEKSDKFNELLKLYEPFKLAQRYLAILITAVYLFIHLIVFSLRLADLFFFDAANQKELIELGKWNNDALFYPFLTILAFYFSGGVINGAVARFSKRIRK